MSFHAQDYTFCSKIQNKDEQELCYLGYFDAEKRFGNTGYCSKLPTNELKELCNKSSLEAWSKKVDAIKNDNN